MNRQALEIRRDTWHIRLASKKSFMSCLMGLVFFSLTFMYTYRSPLRSGIYYAFRNKTIVQAISPELQLQFTSRRNEQSIQHPKRVNIVIMSFPRSGSSFLGDVFNQHPGVFYLFEPLGPLQKSLTKDSGFEFDFSSPSYQNKAFEFFEDIMNCKFSSGIFIRYLNPGVRKRTLALSSPPFCVKKGKSMVCHNLTSHELETVCKNNYSVFAAKVLSPRIPIAHDEWNKNFLQSCSSNGESKCKIIHLVRDPRAVVESLKARAFFRQSHDPRRELSWFVEKVCHQMEFDVKIGKLMRTFLPDGYKLIRFEDLALDPLPVVSELYNFTGIKMLDTVKKWLHEATTSRKGHRGPYSTSRDSKRVVSNWRAKMSSANVQIVENYCGRLMRQLNYTLTRTPLKRPSNLNISLIDKKSHLS